MGIFSLRSDFDLSGFFVWRARVSHKNKQMAAPYQSKKLITKINWPQAALLINLERKEPAIIFTTANTDHYIPIRKLSPTHKHYTTDTDLSLD